MCMALFRPCPGGGECGSEDAEHNLFLEEIELAFLVIFSFEVIVKLVALAGAFFSDGWNVLDLIIVSTGYLVFIFPDVNTSIFRTVRVLRPLRSIGMMPGVRLLIDALIGSLPGLSSVMMLILFVFAIFGVLGVQLFSGTLDYHCVPAYECQPTYWNDTAEESVVNTTATWEYLEYGACVLDEDCQQMQSWQQSGHTMRCGAVAPPDVVPITVVQTGAYGFCRVQPKTPYTCEHRPGQEEERPGFTCIPVSDPLHHGATSFNNIGKVMLILFQLCTTEGWTTIFTPLLDTNSAVTVYSFFAVGLICTSFFLVNFVVAQLVVAFARAVDQQDNSRAPTPTALDDLLRWLKRTFCAHASDLTTDVWAMRAKFNMIDADGSGYLDADEVANLAENLGINVTMEEMDESGTGLINYPQFERWWKMRSMFDRFDEDNSNTLDSKEVSKLVSTLGLHSDFQDCILEMDQNEDGSINYNEFVSWWSIRKRFEVLDISMDDSLSYEELEGLIDLGVDRLLIDTMLQNADTNMDGKIDFHEFMLWWQLHRTFKRFDKDESWELEQPELAELGRTLGLPELKVSTINPRKTEKYGISFEEMTKWYKSQGKETKVALLNLSRSNAAEMEPRNLRYIVQGPIFTNLVLGAVILNFAVLAMDHHNMNPDHARMLEVTNACFTVFFALEMLLKMKGLGLADYFNDQFNFLDCFIVLISLAELASTGDGPLSTFRTLRLLRVARSFKLFTAVDSMRRLLEATMKSGAAILNFALLLETFHVIFSLVGLHLFGDTLSSPTFDAPGRFDSFAASYLTCFQVLTRENWHELLYVSSYTHGWAGFFFFASLITIGNFIIVSLFLGNLLHSLQLVFMAEAKRIKKATQSRAASKVPGSRFMSRQKPSKPSTSILSIAFQGPIKIEDDMSPDDKQRLAALMIQRAWLRRYHNSIQADDEPNTVKYSLGLLGRDNPLRRLCGSVVSKPWFDATMLVFIVVSSVVLAFEHPERETPTWIFIFDGVVAFVFVVECSMKIVAMGLVGAETAYLGNGWQVLDVFVVTVTVIGFFDPQYRPLRILRTFRTIRPLRNADGLRGLRVITEAMVKSMIPVAIVGAIAIFGCGIFAVAFVAMQKGKLYSCEMETCIASEVGLALATDLGTQGELIAVCHAAGLWGGNPRLAREACEGAVWAEHTAALCKYNAPTDCDEPSCYASFDVCVAAGGEWVNSEQNFNHIFAALLTLFELTTLEDWQGVMYNSIDTTTVAVNATLCTDADMSCSQTFEREYRGNMSIGGMFIAFILVGGFFFLNLFLGVVATAIATVDTNSYDKSVQMRENSDKMVYLLSSVTPLDAQTSWYKSVRSPCLKLVTSKAWDAVFGVAIILNIGVMMTETANQSSATEAMQRSANLCFTVLFVAEILIKLLAYNPTRCFRDTWNVLDLFIVIISVAEILVGTPSDETSDSVLEPTLFRTFKLFRLTRLLKLVPHADGLRLIVSAPAFPIPSNHTTLLAALCKTLPLPFLSLLSAS